MLREGPGGLRSGTLHGMVSGMRYSQARMGRIFVARVDHGEDFLGEMHHILGREGISRALMLLLGALREGSLVTGPEEPVVPPSPHWVEFGGGWEVVGIATVYPGEDGPAIHLHGSLGRGERALTGCLRDRAETYLVMEVVIFELLDFPVTRNRDETTGLILPDFGP
jgi:predicted DNA-binding protein with PD1-like motif